MFEVRAGGGGLVKELDEPPMRPMTGLQTPGLFLHEEEWDELRPVLEDVLIPVHPVLVKLERAGQHTIAHRLAMLAKLSLGEQWIALGRSPRLSVHEIATRMVADYRLTGRGFLVGLLQAADTVVHMLTAMFVIQSAERAALQARDRFNLRSDDVEGVADLASILIVKCLPSTARRHDASPGLLAAYEPTSSFLALLIANARPGGLPADERRALGIHPTSVPAAFRVTFEELTNEAHQATAWDSGTESQERHDDRYGRLLATLRRVLSQVKSAPKHLEDHLNGACDRGGRQCQRVEDWLKVVRAAAYADYGERHGEDPSEALFSSHGRRSRSGLERWT
jgi:hypothetical protein